MNNKYITISQINQYLKMLFDTNEHLQKIYLKGEISNFKRHSSGHLYLTLKDDASRINAVMFKSSAAKLTFNPEDGQNVLVEGRVSVYPAGGNYQVYIDKMMVDGLGNLYVEFEKLKQKLHAEGLFATSHKRPLPKFPMKIGIITAPTGAAIKDIISTIKRRFPICETILFPSLVQGAQAKDDIVKNIIQAQDYDLDLLIVGRGGGSIEDLWAFNEEKVARAIYNSKIPVISAVGHEIDYTIADYVADKRAPTPTGAAEMAKDMTNGAFTQSAANLAIILKMMRVILLVPFLLIVGYYVAKDNSHSNNPHHTSKKIDIPYFAFLFLGVIVLNTFLNTYKETLIFANFSVQSLIDCGRLLCTLCIVFAMAALGLQIDFKKFIKLGGKAFGLALVLFAILIFGGYFLILCFQGILW